MDHVITFTVTGWDIVAFIVSYGVLSFLWGFAKAFRRELVKADATFDKVISAAIKNFPTSYIWVRRGWLFFEDHIAVTIITGNPTTEAFEVGDWQSYTWNPNTHRFEKVKT